MEILPSPCSWTVSQPSLSLYVALHGIQFRLLPLQDTSVTVCCKPCFKTCMTLLPQPRGPRLRNVGGGLIAYTPNTCTIGSSALDPKPQFLGEGLSFRLDTSSGQYVDSDSQVSSPGACYLHLKFPPTIQYCTYEPESSWINHGSQRRNQEAYPRSRNGACFRRFREGQHGPSREYWSLSLGCGLTDLASPVFSASTARRPGFWTA